MFGRFKSYFRPDGKSQRRVLTLCAALIAFAALLFGGGKQILKGYESLTSTDRLIELSALLSGRHDAALPVTLIEVDDETRLKWGNPLIAPHAAIAELIEAARKSGARAILVDLDLSSDVEIAADSRLMSVLSAYAPDAPPLLLVRAIRFRAEGGSGGQPSIVADSARSTAYDEATAGKPNIHWVSALPELGKDRAVRRIRLWQTVCEGAAGRAFPSPALVAAAWTANPSRSRDLAEFLETRVAAECGKKDVAAPSWPPHAGQIADIPFSLSTGDPSRFLRLGAWSLVDVGGFGVKPAGEADSHPFAGRLVLIGATHADSRDSYLTPIGSMAGVVVLANTLAMARPMVETPEVSPFTQGVLAFVLFAVFAILAARLQGLVAVALIGGVSLGALMLFSRGMDFGAAVEIVALGLTVFALFKIVDSAAGIAFDWRHGLGWRALLKARPQPGGK